MTRNEAVISNYRFHGEFAPVASIMCACVRVALSSCVSLLVQPLRRITPEFVAQICAKFEHLTSLSLANNGGCPWSVVLPWLPSHAPGTQWHLSVVAVTGLDCFFLLPHSLHALWDADVASPGGEPLVNARVHAKVSIQILCVAHVLPSPSLLTALTLCVNGDVHITCNGLDRTGLVGQQRPCFRTAQTGCFVLSLMLHPLTLLVPIVGQSWPPLRTWSPCSL
jgi:hypothetical protein